MGRFDGNALCLGLMKAAKSWPPPWPAERIAQAEALALKLGGTKVVWVRDGDQARELFPIQTWMTSATSISPMLPGAVIRAEPGAIQRVNDGSGGRAALGAEMTILGTQTIGGDWDTNIALMNLGVWAGRLEDGTHYLLPRPQVANNGRGGAVHCTDGPAIVWPHPQAVQEYYLQGIRVPPEAITRPEKLADLAIDHPNAEVRRVLVAHYGHERLMRERGKIVHRDETGKLWMLLNRSVAMVEVQNSTPEPDGSRRTYMLRVPPIILTAREGVAWTFGMQAKDYSPKVET
jgi:hypothetical protein